MGGANAKPVTAPSANQIAHQCLRCALCLMRCGLRPTRDCEAFARGSALDTAARTNGARAASSRAISYLASRAAPSAATACVSRIERPTAVWRITSEARQCVRTTSKLLSITSVDNTVLDTLAREVLRPRVVLAIVDGVFTAMQPRTRVSDMAALRSELQGIDREIARLTEAIATGGQLTPYLKALKARQARREILTTTLAARQTFASQQFDRKAIEAQVRQHLTGWRGASDRDGPRSRRVVVNSCANCSQDRSRSRQRVERIALRVKRRSGNCSREWWDLQPLWRALQDSNLRPPGS